MAFEETCFCTSAVMLHGLLLSNLTEGIHALKKHANNEEPAPMCSNSLGSFDLHLPSLQRWLAPWPVGDGWFHGHGLSIPQLLIAGMPSLADPTSPTRLGIDCRSFWGPNAGHYSSHVGRSSEALRIPTQSSYFVASKRNFGIERHSNGCALYFNRQCNRHRPVACATLMFVLSDIDYK